MLGVRFDERHQGSAKRADFTMTLVPAIWSRAGPTSLQVAQRTHAPWDRAVMAKWTDAFDF
jgi:hypothetical protein